jgi:fructose/tagatose bisphosphate aldolase
VFHGGSGSALEEIRQAISYGVVKMNVDTDTQYAFTRPVAGHMFTNYDGVRVCASADRAVSYLHEISRGHGLDPRCRRTPWPPELSTTCCT